MSISDLYSSGFRNRNRDHFAAIVRVALSDGEMTEEEKAFLDRLARNLDISQELYDQILENPSAFPVNPPSLYEARLERLFDIARMIFVDHIEDEDELRIMRRLSIGLGFSPDNVDLINKKAMDLIHTGADLDTFMEEIKRMNH
ncbi:MULTISPECIES: TerB family tellurite resistance protein [Galbibacter]|uniref:TerB family tellurite resistance protein n=1 Tax=Galbibacter pacificus TaxID=2996052 RepID=A0ABT6FT34_9FLAO|nr:TerB family tellurite resistance protein [Galbibacter pacificus]MDG3582455.1 TerB family tellurite resistance protein [Galbibacter pacificus]MDG3586427.1 TerB family tellurite resistance protein [Galbibacter pacificus]